MHPQIHRYVFASLKYLKLPRVRLRDCGMQHSTSIYELDDDAAVRHPMCQSLLQDLRVGLSLLKLRYFLRQNSQDRPQPEKRKEKVPGSLHVGLRSLTSISTDVDVGGLPEWVMAC